MQTDWDKRASLFTKYKGENFYTITPLPYYYARRGIIIQSLIDEIRNQIKKTGQTDRQTVSATIHLRFWLWRWYIYSFIA